MYSGSHTPTNQVYNIERNIIIKRILSIILSIILIILSTSCTGPQHDTHNHSSDTGVDSGMLTPADSHYDNEFAGTTLVISDPRAITGNHRATADGSYDVTGMFKYGELARETGMDIEVVGLTLENRTLKILAQDSDVDIYFFFHEDAKQIIDNNLYEPINSDIIDEFNSKTFAPLQKICKDSEGNTVMMPIEYSILSLFIPKKAVEELALKEEDIKYFDDFFEYIKSYNGNRECYGLNSIFNQIENQYNYYLCDFDNGAFDFKNEKFKSLYEALLGNWEEDEYGRRKPTYTQYITRDENDIDKNLFTMHALSGKLSLTDKESNDFYCENFVSFPLPRYDENVKKNIVSVATFAYINPYSKNKEAATKLLEAISQSYYDVINTPTYLLFSDYEMYPETINTDSQLFKEFVAMSENSEILFYNINSVTYNTDFSYMYGEITLDEAIAERSRVVNIMLNE